MDAYKKLILKISAIFVGVLLFLTLFSHTIYTFNLPGVVVEYPREGAIIRTATGRGIVDFVAKDVYYADIAGKIELLVTEGEIVNAGNILYNISADDKLDADMLRLWLERAREDKVYAQTGLQELRVGGAEYDKEIEKTRLLLQTAQKDVEDAIALYAVGAIPKKDLDDKQAVFNNLQLQYQQQSQKKQNDVQELEKKVRDLQYQIEEYELQLNEGVKGKITAMAQQSGVIREIGANIETGAYINQNEQVMKIGVSEKNFKANILLPANVDYLKLGDDVTLSIRSRNIYNIPGVIKRLIMEEGRLQAEVRFAAEGVSGGETAEIMVHDTSELYKAIIPLSAVRTDANREYILYAERVKGSFGYEYHTKRLDIWVQAQNNYTAAIWLFSTSEEKIAVIVNSDKPIFEGDRVRIVGGSDLVEIR
ncbi:MAG: HlyD family secretion protein [Firmicutes bacterium]|nr:HlyD family secretion protein [Bacillota bacterium]